MHTAIEISLYPLDADYIPPIKAFIERLNKYPELHVVTNSMSTQVSGEHRRLFEILAKETETTFAESGRKVFVMKVLGGTAPERDG
ncbi:MAG TPA: YkoF family thiamine/hydroxymethylpyrimidine-binding protein [Steroidobacteraceae bacterium]